MLIPFDSDYFDLCPLFGSGCDDCRQEKIKVYIALDPNGCPITEETELIYD